MRWCTVAFPSTSDSRTTSVGATAIDRFLRPVCYPKCLPNYYQAACATRTLAVPRVVNGELRLGK